MSIRHPNFKKRHRISKQRLLHAHPTPVKHVLYPPPSKPATWNFKVEVRAHKVLVGHLLNHQTTNTGFQSRSQCTPPSGWNKIYQTTSKHASIFMIHIILNLKNIQNNLSGRTQNAEVKKEHSVVTCEACKYIYPDLRQTSMREAWIFLCISRDFISFQLYSLQRCCKDDLNWTLCWK